MKSKEVLKLVNAGFSKDEIFKIFEEEEAETETDEKKTPEKKHIETENPSSVSDSSYDALLQKIDQLTKAVQASNISKDAKNSQKKNFSVEDAADEISKVIIGVDAPDK